MKDMEEIIAAFVDDERVDADALGRALSKPEGREYLLDLLALRELVSDRAAHDVASGFSRTEPAATAAAPRVSRRWLAAAAGLLVATGLAGYGVGQRVANGTAPKSVVQPVQPAPASNEPQTVELLTPPAPTRVIQLEAGKDWQERGGGE
jgi:hypothetical protein